MCKNTTFFSLVWISIIVIADAQQKLDPSDFNKSTSDDEDKLQKQQESIEVLMKQVGDMGMLLENYRRVIVNGVTESSDVCGFIDGLSGPLDNAEKTIEKQISSGNGNDNMCISVYKQFFRDINDPILKTQLFATLENHIDQCYNMISQPRPFMLKRDKNNMQKVRFHSWGGKRNRAGPPKIVIRTPFHAWGGKRSGEIDSNEALE